MRNVVNWIPLFARIWASREQGCFIHRGRWVIKLTVSATYLLSPYPIPTEIRGSCTISSGKIPSALFHDREIPIVDVNKNLIMDAYAPDRAKSIRLRRPPMLDSKEARGCERSSFHALWMMTVTLSRSWREMCMSIDIESPPDSVHSPQRTKLRTDQDLEPPLCLQ